MNIITLDGRTYDVKYKQSEEVISTDFGTGVYNFPDFIGSKLYHNSTSSDKYSLNFAIHSTNLVAFKNSIKTIVTNGLDAVEHPTYGRLMHLVIEHPSFGALFGDMVGSITYETRSQADVYCRCTFIEHTQESKVNVKQLKDENLDALDEIDSETSANFDVDLSARDKSQIGKFADNLTSLYSDIQNSAVISAFNDLNTELNAAFIDSLRVMNAFKAILGLPLRIISGRKSQIELLVAQAAAIKAIPVTSYNLALFNANALSYNMGVSSRTAFVSEAALAAAAGIKTVPMV